jgi:hypothetical protein
MITVYVDLEDTDSGRDISIRETDVRNELVIDMTFYTDPVLNVELFFAKQRLFWVHKD